MAAAVERLGAHPAARQATDAPVDALLAAPEGFVQNALRVIRRSGPEPRRQAVRRRSVKLIGELLALYTPSELDDFLMRCSRDERQILLEGLMSSR